MKNQRYATLRGKLKELGFPQYFSEESLDLVEKLLRSFISLSELYQNNKKELTQYHTQSSQEALQEQILLKENRELNERLNNLISELGMQRKTLDEAFRRLELADKRYHHLSVEHAESNKLKDQRIKALIEDNNSLSATIQKFTARCLASGVPESDHLAKKIADVETICSEMQRDKKIIEKLEGAFKSLEDKQTHLRDEAISLRIQVADYEQRLAQKQQALDNSLQNQTALENDLARQTSICFKD